MKSLKEYIKEAEEKGVALGHFNVSNLEGVHAVCDASYKLGLPVIIGVSEGERDFLGVKEIVALVETFKKEGKPVFLNADHTYSVERVKEAIDAGFDAVIFDGAKFSLEENISKTKECIDYAKNCGREVLVEAELGYIGQSSKVLDGVPEGVQMTSKEDALRFVSETRVNLFAPAVGNIHGMLAKGKNPNLDIERIKEIKEAVKIPLVLHGASGNSDEDIRKAIKAGVSIVHVNTELRVAFRKGLEKALSENPEEVAPYKYEKIAKEDMQKVVEEKLGVFNLL